MVYALAQFPRAATMGTFSKASLLPASQGASQVFSVAQSYPGRRPHPCGLTGPRVWRGFGEAVSDAGPASWCLLKVAFWVAICSNEPG